MGWVPLVGGGADLDRQLVVRGSESIRLTTKERDLIAYLSARPGATVTRVELLVEVWGSSGRASEEPIYSAIKRLRAKIDRGLHQHVVSVHGDGYRWHPPPAEPPQRDASSASSSPIFADRFFGRASERTAAIAALAAPCPLVTLVGPGGAGKTRLACEIAEGRAHVMCDLSTARDEASVIASVASALAVPLAGSDPAAWTRAVGRALATAPDLLLILDNVEQVAPQVAKLFASRTTTWARTLATSREPIGIRGERVIPVGPLSLAEASLLFEDRVSARGGELGELATREAIVSRLDRLPLAIELAAAQAPAMGQDALLASLDDPLATLVEGHREGPARHATLRAAVEWSWAFLAPEERTALVDLSTFVGSFDLHAARAVIARDSAAALVAALCRRSQLQREKDRFQLYAAVRELALEHREERSDAEQRHARYFAACGRSATLLLEGPRHREGCMWLEREAAELRAALERAPTIDPEIGASLALAADAALGLRASETALRAAILEGARSRVTAPETRSALLLAQGLLAGSSLALLEEALPLATSPELRADVGLAIGERLAPQDTAAARAALARALGDATSARAERTRGRIHSLLGEVALLEGAVAEARQSLIAGLALHERLGDHRALARCAAHLAHLDRLESGDGSATELLRRAADAAARLGDPLVSARAALDRGQHLTRIGDQTGARAALEDAARTYERIGFVRERAMTHLHLAETLVGIGDFGSALVEAERALAELDEGDLATSTVHEAIACIHLLGGALGEASSWIESGLALARARGAARSECTLLGKRGLLYLVRGENDLAWHDFDLAARKNEARGSTAITGASLVDRAMAALAAGRDDEAAADLQRARSLLRDPPEERAEGRMLVVCEAAGRAFAAVSRGASALEAERGLRRDTARFFDRVPRSEWDLVLRFLDWLVGRVALSRAPRRTAAHARPRMPSPRRRSR